MYKVVFFDVDGTLLSETDRSMPLSTKEAIEKLIESGIKVVVATGIDTFGTGVVNGTATK